MSQQTCLGRAIGHMGGVGGPSRGTLVLPGTRRVNANIDVTYSRIVRVHGLYMRLRTLFEQYVLVSQARRQEESRKWNFLST